MKNLRAITASLIVLLSAYGVYAADMTQIRKSVQKSLQVSYISSTIALTGMKNETDKTITALAEAKARGDAVEELNIRKMLKDQQGNTDALSKYIATIQDEIAASLK